MAALKWCIALTLLLIFTISSVSGAISVHNIVITPSGNLISGLNPPQRVSGSLTIDFIPEGGLTFDSGNDLTFQSDLDNATWDYTLVIDGNENPPTYVNGKTVDIGGWLLSYSSRRTLALSANFSGDVPQMTTSGQKTLLSVKEINGGFDVNPSLDVTRVANVIVPGSPLNQSGTGQITSIPTTVGTTVAIPVKSTPVGPSSQSLAVPLDILAAMDSCSRLFHLHSSFPMIISQFHPPDFPRHQDYGLEYAVIHILCGIGMLTGLFVLQSAYLTLALKGTDLNSILLLVVLFLMSYFAISAFIVAVGSLISKAFRWTMKAHMITGVVVLLTGPAALFLSETQEASGTAIVVILAAIISTLLALWQARSIRTDLTEDWISRLSNTFGRMKQGPATYQGTGKNSESALSVLNLRLAKGEISLEEYNRLKDAIKK